MARFKVSSLFLQAVASLAVVGLTTSANAGWWHHGSTGGSSGGWGSGGGSSGGYAWGSSGGGSSGGYSSGWGSSGGSSGGYAYGGSSGGSGRVGLFHHHHRRSYGSSGGWGSSGGSSGGYYGGSSGGSSGGTMYYAPMESGKPAAEAPADPSTPAPAPAPGEAPAPAKETSLRSVDGMLAVEVPADARIFVNGQETSSTGAIRQYISRNLQPGYNYTYEVKAEIIRDGKPVEEVKTVDLKAGEIAKVAFNLAPTSKVETSLTVRVPASAKVYLAGNPTKATGETRVFRTTSLTSGSRWSDYTIKVEIEKEGKTITREEKISLGAGETKELTFDFDSEKVADAR